jgi:hypothetical protein
MTPPSPQDQTPQPAPTETAVEEAKTLEGTLEEKNNDANLAVASAPPTKAEQAAEEEDDSKYPSGMKLIVLTLGLCLSTFVVCQARV